MKLNRHMARPKQAMPNIISQRVSKRLARMMYIGVPTSVATPVEKTAMPVCQAL